MDRFSWYQAGVALNEEIWIQRAAVCLYDGEDKTPFEVGTASLTPVRLIWADSSDPGRHARTGIAGIERKLAEHNMRTSENISQAFEDLAKLMNMAKDMVTLSKSISEKIRMKQGDITEDETVRFKSYLLSLGVTDPVTKDAYGGGHDYYQELAKELSRILEGPLKEAGGMMTLPDVYCRVNRARGLELLSPEDLLNACYLLNKMALPVMLHKYDSGVLVIQLRDQGAETKVEETMELVNAHEALTAEQLAQLIGISVVLAKERLLTAEDMNKLCRDESVEGLRFYPNKFLYSCFTAVENAS